MFFISNIRPPPKKKYHSLLNSSVIEFGDLNHLLMYLPDHCYRNPS